MITEINLGIAVPDLEIFYTDFAAGWQRNPDNLFTFRAEGVYHLVRKEGFPSGEEYKFFIHLEEEQDFVELRDAVGEAGYVVTGSGDIDPKSGRRRLWFYDPKRPTRDEGIRTNNVWPEEE